MHIQKLDATDLEKATHEQHMEMLTKQVLFDWKERDEEIAGRVSMFNYAILKPSGYFNQHHHGSAEDPSVGMTEIFFVLSGAAMLKVDSKEYELSDNTLVIVDKGEVHSMKNISDTKPVIYIVFGISNGGPTTVVKESY